MLRNLPLKDPKPNAGECMDILMGRVQGGRTPLVEYIIDEVVMKPILTELLAREWVDLQKDRESEGAFLDNMIELWYRMGYDCIKFERNMGFVKNRLLIPDTADGSEKDRAWADEHRGLINTWEEFEKYPWPVIDHVDFFPFEYINDHLPEGMGLFASHAGGVFEHLSDLMSLEGLCLAMYDDPALVKAVVDKIGTLMEKFYKHILDLDKLYAIFPGDDMGFHTSTLISPSDLRSYVLPWHKRYAEMAHERGLSYFLHSCGNVEKVMEDLISDVSLDGKHSFEDSIIPVNKFQEKFGDRIACLGGIDINFLSVSSPEQVRERTRWLIETCGSRGRYAIGSGNSIPSFIPVQNYLEMIDESLELSSN